MPRKWEWVRVYQGELLKVVCDKEVTGGTLRVLVYLMSQIGYRGGVALQQVTIARELGMAEVSVWRAVRLLQRKGWVRRLRNPRGGWWFRLKPVLVVKGATLPPRPVLKGQGKVVHLRQREKGEGRG
jgi:DNA-binding MarR family transcriptional regulator